LRLSAFARDSFDSFGLGKLRSLKSVHNLRLVLAGGEVYNRGMKLTPNRRWFRFSLRTLFLLMTVFGIWLGWQVRVVHARKALLQEARAYEGKWSASSYYREWCGTCAKFQEQRRSISWLRTLLGDVKIGHVQVAQDTPQQLVDRLYESFPGADIVVGNPDRS
jgi:hypothetical protein